MHIYLLLFLASFGMLSILLLSVYLYFTTSDKAEKELFESTKKHKKFLRKYMEYEKSKR